MDLGRCSDNLLLDQQNVDEQVFAFHDVFCMHNLDAETDHVLHDQDVDDPRHFVELQVDFNVFSDLQLEIQDHFFFEY